MCTLPDLSRLPAWPDRPDRYVEAAVARSRWHQEPVSCRSAKLELTRSSHPRRPYAAHHDLAPALHPQKLRARGSERVSMEPMPTVRALGPELCQGGSISVVRLLGAFPEATIERADVDERHPALRMPAARPPYWRSRQTGLASHRAERTNIDRHSARGWKLGCHPQEIGRRHATTPHSRPLRRR